MGTWSNESIIDIDGSSITAIFNYSIQNFPVDGGTLGWRVWTNDSAGNVNISKIYTLTVQITPDTTPPTYSNFQNNGSTVTRINGVVNWSINLSENIGLSFYIFAHNNSGTLTNVSNGTLSGTLAFVNKTVSITQEADNYICGQFWINDTRNNINQTLLTDSNACFTVAAEPEEPEEPGAPTGGAGGGGGAGGIGFELVKERGLEVSKSLFKVDIISGKTKTKVLTITNTGEIELSIDIDIENIDEYLSLSDTAFDLYPAQSKTIILNFLGKETGTQIGNIMVKASGIRKAIPVIMNIESEDVLFDVKMDIPAEFRELKVGENLSTQVSLLSMGEPKKVDVFITYIIKDLNNNIISKDYETVAVEKELSFVKTFHTTNLKPDRYVASIEVDYANSIAVSGSLFTIEGPEMPSPIQRLLPLLVVVAIILLISIIHSNKKEKKPSDLGFKIQKVLILI